MNGIRTTAVVRLAAAAAMSACLLGTSVGVATAAGSPSADTDWGDTKKWGGGLEVTVSQPVKFTPSAYSIGHEAGNQAVKWRIKVHNGTDEAFQGALMTVYAKSGNDGDTCEQIFDGDLGAGITGSVSPGSSGAAEFAFDVPRNQLSKVDLEVRPLIFHDGKHWVGDVK
ncbi:DUF4352 domain-containing protein [Streptomyces sp. SID14478]|uniref:DUF4352 domain-containing protein n=1 Tax=Streptomyces sp. SID14478 TaxID=2706073 RepID=UPI0013DC8F05|nr:DUF4352 domain-containing protein [Streptomyces sp. SID14478]NEB79444.1 DUF4352 domain-containing protein [Streptomyces sp. SID14478]